MTENWHCTRQLHYSLNNENSIDIVLFLNGIPVVSMELKCQFTGQNTTNAINQYKFDRAGKDAIFAFKERVLVHFAIDLTKVYMTTRLEGNKTYFLPFNQGSNGAGNVGGQGNPINPDGYDTAYLWEEVLQKDRLLEILHKYLHLQVERDEKTGEIKSERMIFPRYHQLDVVTKLLADVKENGSGKNYLIQHSVYQQNEIEKFANIFYSSKEQERGDMGRLHGHIKAALDRYDETGYGYNWFCVV